MYVKENSKKIIFDLHLDQKEPSYGGTHAHNAEYTGEVVSSEIDRLKTALGIIESVKSSNNNSSSSITIGKAEDEIGSGSYDKTATQKKEKGFFSSLFS